MLIDVPAQELRHRAELLREELRGQGIDEALVDEPRVISELVRCIFPAVHEGRTAPFGAIVCDAVGRADVAAIGAEVIASDDEALVSRAADGSSTFVLSDVGSRQLVRMKWDSGTDEQLAWISRVCKVAIVHRNNEGSVRLFGRRGIYTNEGRRWWFRPSGAALSERILRHAPQVDRAVLLAVLGFALVVLSPGRFGATLVLLVGTREFDAKGGGLDLRPLGMNVAAPHRLSTAAHVLSQVDGATIIQGDGAIRMTGVHLQPSERARTLVPQQGGTRHTSAKQYSFDDPACVVVTISSDGPVSIFSDGVEIGHVPMYSADTDRDQLAKAIPERATDIDSESYEEICTTCGKTALIEKLTIVGWKDSETVGCPVCGRVIASARCHRLEANVLKQLP